MTHWIRDRLRRLGDTGALGAPMDGAAAEAHADADEKGGETLSTKVDVAPRAPSALPHGRNVPTP